MRTVKFNYREVVDQVLQEMNFDRAVCLDATCGNGHDSLNIIKRLDENGFLYCTDIQDLAIENTDKLLKEAGYKNYKPIKKSHDLFADEIEESFRLVIFNLGYLPGSDKKIVTRAETTIKAIDSLIKKLDKDGVIIVVSYLGHPNSKEERESLDKYLKNLSQKDFLVEKRQFYNQVNNPPIVYLIGVR